MPIYHSFSILFCNFKLVAKLLLFIFVIFLVAASILIGILNPVLDNFFEELQQEIPIDGDYFFKHPILSLQIILDYFTDFLENNPALVATRLVYIWLLVTGFKFFVSLPLLPVTKILHSKMTTGFDMGFLNATISTVKENLLFCLVSAIVLGIADLLIFAAMTYVFIGLAKLIGILSLPVSFLITLVIYSLRITLLCQWLPEMCASSSKNIFKALKHSFKPVFRNFRKNFICVFVILVTVSSVVLSTVLPTFGLVPILMIPTYIVLYCSLCLTLSCSFYHQKYFIDNGVTIYNPVKKY